MSAAAGASLGVVNLGVMPYGDALTLQRAAAHARIDGSLGEDVLLLVEHPAVITFGRSTNAEHLLLDRSALAERDVELFEVERGGDITFHGRGQLVAYPVIDLRQHRTDLHWYLRQLEEVLIRALSTFDLAAERRPKLTGVWTDGRKIASIGVHARSWVTWHGFALNITTDLSYFDLIIPCGIDNVEMTSVARELASDASDTADLAERARWAVTDAFANVFALSPAALPIAALHEFSPGATGR